MSEPETCDVIVIGGGSSAFEAAVSARQSGAEKVVMLEKAPEAEYGGNARFSHTGFRFCHSGRDEVREFIPHVEQKVFDAMEIKPYTKEAFLGDLNRVTEGLIDEDLADMLAGESNAAAHWALETGIKWVPEKWAEIDGRYHFEPGRNVQTRGGGKGQLEQWREIAAKMGIEIRFESRVSAIYGNNRRMEGVRVSAEQGEYDLLADATIACAGGFQANPEMRARYLGDNADLLKVRGSKHDTGEVLNMILSMGARATGHWQGAHQTPIDAGAPRFETPVLEGGQGNSMNRYDYCHGITVNSLGQRFFDEGESFHSYTYAKTGRAVRGQPGNIAYQIYDQKGIAMFRHGRDQKATHEEAGTIEELAQKVGLNPEILGATVRAYNAAVADEIPFDASKLDGKCTRGIAPVKSNWAQKIDQPPFRAYPVSGGITFTFGGLAISTDSEVLNTSNQPIRGLFASGDIIGLFYHNYPSCTGQTRNLVFSRKAGRNAAAAGN
ncbi:MAG: FAD-dependent tricarballylate dehydrogenase TcuA [Alphaproteobacteria bacterium]|nr:FAD-dependent tricarballylate dehydrogenase TcuA [Alphaproteobacteria bacterium]